jgi:hypothetical protein
MLERRQGMRQESSNEIRERALKEQLHVGSERTSSRKALVLDIVK